MIWSFNGVSQTDKREDVEVRQCKKDTMVERRNDSDLTHLYLQRLNIVLRSMLRAGRRSVC
jgi:hypothetical protein